MGIVRCLSQDKLGIYLFIYLFTPNLCSVKEYQKLPSEMRKQVLGAGEKGGEPRKLPGGGDSESVRA